MDLESRRQGSLGEKNHRTVTQQPSDDGCRCSHVAYARYSKPAPSNIRCSSPLSQMLEAFSVFGYCPPNTWLDALESATLAQLQQTVEPPLADVAVRSVSSGEQGSRAGWKLQPRLSPEELVLLLEGLSSAAAAAAAAGTSAAHSTRAASSRSAAPAASAASTAAASGDALQRPAGRWLSAWASQLGVNAVRALSYGLAMRLVILLAQPHLQGFLPSGRWV